MKEESIQPELILCDCHNTEHQLVIYYEDDKDLGRTCYLHINLVRRPWYRRLREAWRHLWGYTSRYGHFDEFILQEEDADKFRRVANFLDEKKRKNALEELTRLAQEHDLGYEAKAKEEHG